MKNNKRRVLILAVVLVLVASVFMGCGSKEEAIKKALQSTQEIKSFDYHMTMTLDMSLLGQRMNMELDATGSQFMDPMRMKMNARVTSSDSDGFQEVEMYVEESEDKMILYQNSGYGWQKEELSRAEYSDEYGSYSAEETMDLYIKNAKNFKILGRETMDGVNVLKLGGYISGDSLSELIMNDDIMSGMMGGTSSSVEDQEMMERIFNSLPDLEFYVWVEAKNYTIRGLEIDMTDFLTSFISEMMTVMAEEDDSVDVESMMGLFNFKEYKISIKLSNIDNATPFEMPADQL